MSELNEIDFTLERSDIMEELGFDKYEVQKFLERFGHRVGAGRKRVIGQREIMFMRLDGTLAEWVKNNCKPGRQTISERKGKKDGT